MDPLTHCLLGGLAAKTAKTSRKRFWIMLLLGSAPDLDVLANGLGSWAYAIQHRGITHSLVGIVLQSLFYAWALARWDKGPFRQRALQYSLPLGLHVLCDFLTCHGVPLLSPFSFQEFSADLVVALSLVPAAFMAWSLFRMHRRDHGGWQATRPVWAAWAIYLCLALSGKAYAGHLAGTPTVPFKTIPTVVNPFNWRAVYLDSQTHSYRTSSIDLLRGQRVDGGRIAMPNSDFPVRATMKSAAVREFLRDNRWPVARFTPNDKGWRVEWGNLLFSTNGMVRSKMLVDVAWDGTILKERKTFGFWNPDHN